MRSCRSPNAGEVARRTRQHAAVARGTQRSGTRRSRRDGQNGGVMPNRSSATRSRWIGGSVVGVVGVVALAVVAVRPGRVGGRPPEHAGAVDHTEVPSWGTVLTGDRGTWTGTGITYTLCLAALRHQWGQLHADRRCDRPQVHADDCRPRGDDPIRGHGLGQLGRGHRHIQSDGRDNDRQRHARQQLAPDGHRRRHGWHDAGVDDRLVGRRPADHLLLPVAAMRPERQLVRAALRRDPAARTGSHRSRSASPCVSR